MKKYYDYPVLKFKEVEFDEILVVSKVDDVLDIFDDGFDEEL